MVDSSATFESHRPAMLAPAYRMLGEMARAEDVSSLAAKIVHQETGRLGYGRRRSVRVDGPNRKA